MRRLAGLAGDQCPYGGDIGQGEKINFEQEREGNRERAASPMEKDSGKESKEINDGDRKA